MKRKLAIFISIVISASTILSARKRKQNVPVLQPATDTATKLRRQLQTPAAKQLERRVR